MKTFCYFISWFISNNFYLNRKFVRCFNAILFNYQRQWQQLKHQAIVRGHREWQCHTNCSDCSAGRSLCCPHHPLGQELSPSLGNIEWTAEVLKTLTIHFSLNYFRVPVVSTWMQVIHRLVSVFNPYSVYLLIPFYT